MQEVIEIKTKKCPVCGETKSIDQFYNYFSKERNKTRISNYCKPCSNEKARASLKKSYYHKRDERLKYAREYRKNNPEKIKALSAKFKKQYIERLHDCYVAQQAAKSLKCTIKEVREIPDLLQAYKNNIKLKRIIKNNGKE